MKSFFIGIVFMLVSFVAAQIPAENIAPSIMQNMSNEIHVREVTCDFDRIAEEVHDYVACFHTLGSQDYAMADVDWALSWYYDIQPITVWRENDSGVLMKLYHLDGYGVVVFSVRGLGHDRSEVTIIYAEPYLE